MIELIYANKTERLLGELADYLQAGKEAGTHPLEPVELVVPNRNMEAFVSLGLAEHLGVAANLRFRRLERFIGEIISETCPGEFKPANLEIIEAAILKILLDDSLLKEPELKPVERYLMSSEGRLALSQSAEGSGEVRGSNDPEESKGGPGTETSGNNFMPAGDRTGAFGFPAQLAADGADLRRVQLAGRLAYLFQEYIFSRPEMVVNWREGRDISAEPFSKDPFTSPAAADSSFASTAEWQRAIFRAVFAENGILEKNPPTEGGRWITLDQLIYDDTFFERVKETGLPPVHIFGMSYVARIFQHLFYRLGEASTLRIYTLNPCAEFWEDLETDRDLFHRLEKQSRGKRSWLNPGPFESNDETGAEGRAADEEDPFGLNQADTPALRYWGRPGREHVRLLDELTECDFKSAFADPLQKGSGLLQHLQRDILYREPEKDVRETPEEVRTADETIRLVAAPSVRREVEWVADEIWRLMREDSPAPGEEPLRFSDVAVIVNSAEKDIYLPQIETVFEACHNLPSSVSDLPGTAGSSFIEAMEMLISLPFGRFSRAEVLNLVSHPAVIGSLGDLKPEDLAKMADDLGIMFGIDNEDHRGTYIDEDVFNWDQGIRRLALGTFMTGNKSGDDRIFETGQGRWLVEELSGQQTGAAARFGLLVRSLLADCRFVREEKLSLSEWAQIYRAQLDAYLHPADPGDTQDRLRILHALSRLENMDLGSKVSGRVAAEIASKALESLGGGRGRYLAEGVVVSSFLPMRAIPFRVVFVLGLGEGLFPASEQRDALDLRAAKRRAGDVDPAERDRYMFLETLLCAREKLYLSYVRRDGQTGDPLQPSAVVQELLHILKTGYLGEEGLEDIKIEPPLWRFDEISPEGASFLDEAKKEARIMELSRALQKHLPEDTEEGTLNYQAIRRHLSTEQWEKLSAMLSLPPDPPEVSPVTAVARTAGSGEEENATEEPLHLSLRAIRAFLECPMQGWARVMLGLTEEEDDLLEREEEDFTVGRALESIILRGVFLDAAATGLNPEKLYDEQAKRLRLAGRIPVGVLGRVHTMRHHKILQEWRERLTGYREAKFPTSRAEENEPPGKERKDSYKEARSSGDPPGADFRGSMKSGTEKDSASAPFPVPLHRVRLGRSGEQSSAETVLDPLVLEVPLSETEENKKRARVHLSGLSEGLLKDNSVSVTFHPGTAPGWSSNGGGRIFRLLLRGIVDHLVLSAMGLAGEGERRALICYAGEPKEKGIRGIRLQALEPEKARKWLETIVADLLSASHAYLLPCEAVFEEFYNLNKEALEEGTAYQPVTGAGLRERVIDIAGKEHLSFSSLWGPVPSPRTYQPPRSEEAEKMINRRFGPLLEMISGLEDF